MILDMASGRIDESQFSSDEEQEVFAGFIIEEIEKSDKLVKHSMNKTCFEMWMTRWKTFSTYGRKKGEAIPMLSYTLVRRKKKATLVVMKNLPQKKADQMLFNGLANCNKLMLRNSPFVVARPEISEKMQLPKISSMYLSTMLTLMKSSDTPSRTSSRRKDYPSDLRRMKLVRGEVRTRQIGNLVATMWRDKRVVSLLSTNTSPEPEIHTIRQVVRGRRK